MSQAQITSQPIATSARQLCYLRKAAVGMNIDGESDGWVLDARLICMQVTLQTGAAMGTADFMVLPLPPEKDTPGESQAVEDLLAKYTTDDQVRVILEPYADPANGGAIIPLFEGVLQRHLAKIVSQDKERGEQVQLTAWPMPAALDAHHIDHTVTGRWIADKRDSSRPTGISTGHDVYFVESPVMPATFNWRGYPNKHPNILVRCGKVDKQIEASVFTYEGDTQGEYWRVGDAIAGIVAVFGMGATQVVPLKRNFDIGAETLEALKDPGATEDTGKFRGFSEVMPEIDITGMGLWEALETVCKKTDFDFCLAPAAPGEGPAVDADLPADAPPDDEESDPLYDRRYVLHIWRKGEGDIKWFDLAKRDTAFDDTQAFAKANNLRTLNMLRDGREVANVIHGVGRELFEVRLELKPLWESVEMDPTRPDQGQIDPDDEELRAPGSYASRHVTGGGEFDKKGYIARRWGIRCRPDEQVYYTDADYGQPSTGFDWVHSLGLSDDGSAVLKWRTDHKIPDSMRWTKRARPLLPLRSPSAKKASVEYFLEVSENFGISWLPAPQKLQFTALREAYCGILLTVNNLCAINVAVLATGEPINDVELSWWNLIRLKALRFRITCCVEGDHAYRVDAKRKPDSGSVYEQAQHVIFPIERVWVQPQSQYNATDKWASIPGWMESAKTDGQDPDLDVLVQRRQESLQGIRQTGRGDLRCLAFDYLPGQRIAGVRGRGLDFKLGGGRDDSFPNVASVTHHLYPGHQQATLVTLSDDTYAPPTISGGGGKTGATNG